MTDEKVWQTFFEKNTWIFGYGLSFIFNSSLEGEKLELVVAGYDFNNSGKRLDAILKTRGAINSLCFVEIKTHKTSLLKTTSYRKECWSASNDLSGAISQVHTSVQKTIKNFSSKVEIKDKDTGDLTGENIYIYQPKSYVVIGNLFEFKGEHGINEDKYSSFELLRQNMINPEIITFDELYERAKFIVEHGEKNAQV